MASVLGVDARRPQAWFTVRLQDGRLKSIATHDSLEAILEAAAGVEVIAVDIPIGHDDPRGTHRGGRRAADVAARQALGAAGERVFWTPPLAVFEREDHDEARRVAEHEGWPVPPKPMFAGRKRLLAINEAIQEDDRFVEIHPEVSYQALNQQQGGSGALETYGRNPRATYERLQLLAEVGLRPTRSMGGVGRMSPRDVLEASIAAWSAHRVAEGLAQKLPPDPPTDPRSDRPVCIWC